METLWWTAMYLIDALYVFHKILLEYDRVGANLRFKGEPDDMPKPHAAGVHELVVADEIID